MHLEPAPVERPNVVLLDKDEHLDNDLRILRWHLSRDEQLLAICTANALTDGALEQFGNKFGRRLDSVAAAVEATLRRQDILEAATTGYEQGDVMIAVTDARVLVAHRGEFHAQGVVRRSIPNAQIRYMRYHAGLSGDRAGVDLITKNENFAWRFAKRSDSRGAVRAVAALMAEWMNVPEDERSALSLAPSIGSSQPKELAE